MAQDEKMLRLIRELAEKGAKTAGCDGWRAEAMCGEIVKVIDQALSAAPAQPVAVEASRKDFVGEGDVVKAGVVYGPLSKDYLIGVLADRDLEIATLRAHPSPPADDALRVAVEALEPFATHPDFHAADDWPVTFMDDEERIPGVTAGDFRRAAEALAALKAGGVK